MRRNITKLLEKSVQVAEELPSATSKSPVAASSSNLGIFGISVQQLETNANSEEEASDDCYVVVQASSMRKFFSKLLCPSCKQPCISFDEMTDMLKYYNASTSYAIFLPIIML